MKPHTSTMAQTSRLVDALEYQLGDIIILYVLDDEKKALVHPPCQDTQHSVRTDCSVITVGVGTPPLTEQFTSALQSVHHAVTQPCNPRLALQFWPASVSLCRKALPAETGRVRWFQLRQTDALCVQKGFDEGPEYSFRVQNVRCPSGNDFRAQCQL